MSCTNANKSNQTKSWSVMRSQRDDSKLREELHDKRTSILIIISMISSYRFASRSMCCLTKRARAMPVSVLFLVPALLWNGPSKKPSFPKKSSYARSTSSYGLGKPSRLRCVASSGSNLHETQTKKREQVAQSRLIKQTDTQKNKLLQDELENCSRCANVSNNAG